MKKLVGVCLFLMFTVLASQGSGIPWAGQVNGPAGAGSSEKVYTIQVAASKVYIDPEMLKEQFKITGEIRYFLKDGWYKYVVGTFKTEAEATGYLAGLKMEAFVTSYTEPPVSGSSPVATNLNQAANTGNEVKAVSSDTTQPAHPDSVMPQLSSLEIRQVYNVKIRQADSEFNIAKDLVTARKLYQEAGLLSPDKNYPKDQIVEIDKKLIQKQSQSFFSTLTLRFYIIAGLVLLFILTVVFAWILLRRRKMKTPVEEEADEADYTHLFQQAVRGSVVAPAEIPEEKKSWPLSVINELYPNLAWEISSGLNGTGSDDALVQRVIEKCLNSFDAILRMEAELAMMRFDRNDPLAFLGKLNRDFTYWEQLHVYESIKRLKLTPPDFTRWVRSTNESVAFFCLRMIGGKDVDETINKPKGELQTAAMQILNRNLLPDKTHQPATSSQ